MTNSLLASACARAVHVLLLLLLLLLLLQRPITVNFGMQMPGWYDIASLEDINAREDKEGLHESQR
jgi:hypothetical protein